MWSWGEEEEVGLERLGKAVGVQDTVEYRRMVRRKAGRGLGAKGERWRGRSVPVLAQGGGSRGPWSSSSKVVTGTIR